MGIPMVAAVSSLDESTAGILSIHIVIHFKWPHFAVSNAVGILSAWDRGVRISPALITDAIVIFVDYSAERILDHCLPCNLSHDSVQCRTWVVLVPTLES